MLCKKPEVSKWSRSLLGFFLVTPYRSAPRYPRLPQMAQAKIGKPDFFPMNQKIKTVSIFFPMKGIEKDSMSNIFLIDYIQNHRKILATVFIQSVYHI